MRDPLYNDRFPGVSATSTTTINTGGQSSSYKKCHKKSKKSIERSRSGLGSGDENKGVGSVGGDVAKGVNAEGGNTTGHNLSQDDKAAKVAALSQALNYIDKFRRNQVQAGLCICALGIRYL